MRRDHRPPRRTTILAACTALAALALLVVTPRTARAAKACDAACIGTHGFLIERNGMIYAYSTCISYVFVVECIYRRVEDGDPVCCYA